MDSVLRCIHKRCCDRCSCRHRIDQISNSSFSWGVIDVYLDDIEVNTKPVSCGGKNNKHVPNGMKYRFEFAANIEQDSNKIKCSANYDQDKCFATNFSKHCRPNNCSTKAHGDKYRDLDYISEWIVQIRAR